MARHDPRRGPVPRRCFFGRHRSGGQALRGNALPGHVAGEPKAKRNYPSAVLQIIHRLIAGFLLKQAGVKRTVAGTGAVTLIQRFGSAANLNIHLHCLVLDGV